jgi:hypothetical protein
MRTRISKSTDRDFNHKIDAWQMLKVTPEAEVSVKEPHTKLVESPPIEFTISAGKVIDAINLQGTGTTLPQFGEGFEE